LLQANALISDEGEILLADFGLSKLMQDAMAITPGTSLRAAGALQWMAPELLEEEFAAVTKETDIYSFGMMAIEIFTGQQPYHTRKMNDYQIYMSVLADQRPERPDPPARELGLSDLVWELIQGCWAPNPTDRLTVLDVARELEAEHTRRAWP